MILLNAMLARLAAYRIYRKTFAELASLDDRVLADMGFARSDIARVARDAAKAA